MAEKALPPEDGASIAAQVQVDAHVIRQLGDQLVTDAEQALIELIKNCWDADATKARVTIEPDFQDGDDPGSGVGRIVVKDDGCGMDRDAIARGWLTISLSPKREMKRLGKTTGTHHRTPLGDKGLGRLGTMKLGNVVRINTHHDKNSSGWSVSLAWSDFESGKLLSKVPITLKPIPATGETGTRVEIRGLVDPAYWRGERRLRDLQLRLSGLVSPFEEFSSFRVTFSVDGKSINLEKVSTKLRETATARISCKWDDEKLVCRARFKVSLFDSGDDEYAKWVDPDGGRKLFAFLESLPAAAGFGLAKPKGTGDWFVELRREWSWDELAGKKPGGASYSKPGPFDAELDAFTLDSDAREQSNIFSNLQAYRAFIKAQAGVRVYRDGFGIRMPEDWLGLGKSWTSGRSYYGLRPNNTIGYVAISAKGNPKLEEKSDREGFIDSPAVRGFTELTGAIVKFANDGLTFLRRSYVDFREERTAEEATLPNKWEPEDAVERLKSISKAAKSKRKGVEKSTEARRATLQKVQTHLSRVLASPSLTGKAHAELEEALAQFERVMKEFETQKSELDDLVNQIADEEKLAEAILDKFGQLKGQIDDVYETVGLGLVAQALAHDLHAIVDDLLVRTQKVARRVKALDDPHVAGYLEAVRATANSVRKQLTLLDPMLRAARETRQTFSIAQFVREFVDLRKERLERFGIASPIEVMQDANITFNRGRLLQVFDNLFRNSEYWLRQYSSEHPKAELAVSLQIDGTLVLVSDTGAGVKPALERTLFELFVTDKPRGEGNGLGLFIVRQLLESEGCSIRLGAERNRSGRRNQFVLDFTGAKSE